MAEATYICREDFDGAIDGIHVTRFTAGSIYALPIDFAADLINSGVIAPCADAENKDDDDYTHYVVAKDFDQERDDGGTERFKAGQEIGMSEADAVELIEQGLITAKQTTPKRKAKRGAPKNKAR
jgi:hypothetical protein